MAKRNRNQRNRTASRAMPASPIRASHSVRVSERATEMRPSWITIGCSRVSFGRGRHQDRTKAQHACLESYLREALYFRVKF